jgi:cell division protease FtsH
VAEQIDQEVKKLVTDSFDKARAILKKYRSKLDAIAKKLLEVETLNREDFLAIFPTPVEKKSGTPVLNSSK